MIKRNKFFGLLLLIFVASVFYYTETKKNITPVISLPQAKTAIGTKENPYDRMDYERRMLVDPATGKIPENIRSRELRFARTLPRADGINLKKGATGTVWSNQGPINRGGRTRALAVDVRTQTPGSVTLIAAGVSGGIYKSTDDGQSWTNKLAPELIHSATCIIQDTRPGHEDTWYVGTGETIGNSAAAVRAPFYGNGIFKSDDNGETWAQIPSTVTPAYTFGGNKFQKIHKLAINVKNGDLYGAMDGVIYKSTDGWATYTKVYGSTLSLFSDVSITSTGTIYAASESGYTESGIGKSTDGGNTWTDITPADFATHYERIVSACAPSDTGIVYFFVFTPDLPPNLSQIWKYNATDNSWANYTENMPRGKQLGNLNTQNGYDMILQVKPDDPNFVVVGGINLYRTTNGFSSKMDSTDWLGGTFVSGKAQAAAAYHPDQHSLVFLNAPNSAVLYSGSDGGIIRNNDITRMPPEWDNLNNGYITSQFYSLAIDPTTPNNPIIIGGLQDNSNYFTNSTDGSVPWKKLLFGGDGGITAIASGRTDYYYETQHGNIFRTQMDEAGNTINWTKIRPAIDSTKYILFVNPFVLDPNDNKMMYYAGSDSLWINRDVTAIPWGNRTPTLTNWSPITDADFGQLVSAIGVSKTPANRVYAGAEYGKILRIDDANSAAPTVTNVSTGSGMPAGYVICLYVNPEDADEVTAVFSNYSIKSLYHTTDGGFSWQSISGNLEDDWGGVNNGPSCRWFTALTVNGVTTYYTATSVGLFSATNLNGDSTVWQQESADNIGNVVCTMVRARQADGLVLVATHGAGIFSNLSSLSDIPVVYFPGRTDFTVANEPTAIASGDLNADNREDLAVVTEAYPYGLYILLNNRTDADIAPSFIRKHLLDFPYGPPTSVAIGDLNGDSRLDMAVVFSGWTHVLVYLNTTTPGDTALTFQQTEIPEDDIHSQIIIGDLNKDGKPDLAMTSGGTSDSLVTVFINNTPAGNPAPVFAEAAHFASGLRPSSLVMADMNIDGMPDLVCSNYDGRTLSVLFNTADSAANSVSFTSHSDVFLGTYNYPTSIGSSDFNNDDVPDVVISSDAVDSVFVFLNATPYGSFTPVFSRKFSYTTGLQFAGSRSVTAKDLNGDGRAEFVTANLSNNSISIFENHTIDGAFSPNIYRHNPLAAGHGPQSITTGDFNGDKRSDLATANWGEQTVSIFLNSTEYTVSGVVEPTPAAPRAFTLKQNYPNPFNPTTHISFYVPRASSVSLKIYDLLGRQLREINQGNLQKGNHSFTFNARGLASGVYIYRISATNGANSVSAVKKMIVLK